MMEVAAPKMVRISLAHPLVLGHVGRDHGGVRAQLQRLEHRHGRAGAELARDVAGGRHHAAPAGVADDHRLIASSGRSRFSTEA